MQLSGTQNGCSEWFFSILLLNHRNIFTEDSSEESSGLISGNERCQSPSSGDWLKDWSWLALNLLKPLLQVVKECVLCFKHLLDRWLVFNVSLGDVRVNLLDENKCVVFVDSRPRLSDDASHHKVEPLALVRQLFQPVCFPPDHLWAQSLPAFSPVSNSIGQRVTLCQFCWCGRIHGGLPAGRGQILSEGSAQRKQFLHGRRGQLFLEHGCHWRCRLHMCGRHGDRWQLRAGGKWSRPIFAALPSERQPPCSVHLRKAILTLPKLISSYGCVRKCIPVEWQCLNQSLPGNDEWMIMKTTFLIQLKGNEIKIYHEV